MSDTKMELEGDKPDGSSLGTHDGTNRSLGSSSPQHSIQSHLQRHQIGGLQRRLQQRHIQMIAIAGTIGTGLFFASGQALSIAGPLGALLAYALVGSVAYASLCSFCEMTTWAPISGTFPHFAERWVDPALGFAVGWNYFYANAISTAVEIKAAVILMTYWDKDAHHAVYYTIAIVALICSLNLFGVRWFGEAEFVFSTIKIMLIIVLLIAGLIIDLGGGSNHDRIGFRYWKRPGALAGARLVSNIYLDRFLGIISAIVLAAFSYQGMELVAIAASETESPRRNITKAVHRVLYRIIIFYILGILMFGMLVASNDPGLLQSSGTAAQSPFVIAMSHTGVKVLPHVVNGAILTSAFSAGNSLLFCSSRILYGLAIRGQAPHFLTRCTTSGLPQNAVLVSSIFSFLSFMRSSSGAETVFNWLVNISTTAGFLSWLTMNFTYIYFYQAIQAQDRDLRENAYNNKFQPYLAYWGCAWTGFFILISGFNVFWKFKASGFIAAYINIPIFFFMYVGYKYFKGTKVWKRMERDLVSDIPDIDETELQEVPPKNTWERIFRVIF